MGWHTQNPPTTSVPLEAAVAKEIRGRLGPLETTVDELRTQLDRGLADLRAELGSIKFETRFNGTLRISQTPQDSESVSSTTKGCSTPAVFDGLGAHRLGSLENTQTSVMNLQPTEGSLGSTARLEAVEAALKDIHRSIQEVSSMPEATEQLIKAEFRHEIEQLRDAFELGRTRAEHIESRMFGLAQRMELTDASLKDVREVLLSETVSAVDHRLDEAARDCEQSLSRAGELHRVLKGELMQDLQILRTEMQAHHGSSEAVTLSLERRLEAYQNQSTEANAVCHRLEVAVRRCDEQLSRADSVRALLEEEQRCRVAQDNELMNRVDVVEQIVGTKLSTHNDHGSFESSLETAGQQCRCADQSEDIERLREEMRKTRLELETSCLKRAEAVSTSLWTRLDDNDRTLSEAIGLQGRFEEVVGDHNCQLQKVGELKTIFNEELAFLTSRFDKFEQALDAQLSSSTVGIIARVDKLEEQSLALMIRGEANDHGASILTSVQQLENRFETSYPSLMARLETLEARPVAMPQPAMGSAAAPCEEHASELKELREALATTAGDVASLARDLAVVREEYDAAIAGIGGLTEYVARSAAKSMQQMEERFADELAVRRDDFDRAARAQREAFSCKADAILAEVVRLPRAKPAIPEFGCGDDSSADFRAAVLTQLAACEKRAIAAEAGFQADLKAISTTVSRLESVDLTPRVAALETAVVAACQGRVLSSLPAARGRTWDNPLLPAGIATTGSATFTERARSPLRNDAAESGGLRRMLSPVRGALQGSVTEEIMQPALGETRFSAARGRSASPTRHVMDVQQQQQQQLQQPGHLQQPQQSQQSQQHRQQQQPHLTQLAHGKKPCQMVGLMDKLEGIVSSVHEVLGTLDMKQSSAASKLRSAMMPTHGDVVVAPSNPTLSDAAARTPPSVNASVMQGARPSPGHQPQREQSPLRRPQLQQQQTQQQTQQQQQQQHLKSVPTSPHSAHSALSSTTAPWSLTFHGNSKSPGNGCSIPRTREHSPTRNALDATTNAWDVPLVQRVGQNALVDPVPSGSSSGCGGAQTCRSPPPENSWGSIPRRSAALAPQSRGVANLAVAAAFAAPPPSSAAVPNLMGHRGSLSACSGDAHQAMSPTHGKTPALSLDAWSSQGVNAVPSSARSNGSGTFQPTVQL